MHHAMLIRDLAVVMIVSGLTTLLFRWLKQPVVLGYLLAGLLIGPHTLPAPLVRDQASIQTLADLGLLFLMFSLGLDFSLKKLGKVGTSAGLAAVFEIAVLVWIGVVIGGLFGWPLADRILLGCGLAISSTAIIVKALRDGGEMNGEHAGLISGMLVVEDIFIILVMTFLPGFLHGGEVPAGRLTVELLKLPAILIALLVVGLLAVPRLLQFVSRFKSSEMLLIIVLALLFGGALLMDALRYSSALGAFIIGALAAESRALGRIKDLTEPLRDMFSAVFFVAMGMLIAPDRILPNIVPILVLTAAFMLAKIAACSLGLFAAGHNTAVSLRAGLNMAQLGEFAFILATLGAGAAGGDLFPVFVSIAVLNAIARPYIVNRADLLAAGLARFVPPRITSALVWFNRTVGELRRARRGSAGARFAWSLLMQVAINCALVAALFLLAAFAARILPETRWSRLGLENLPGGSRPLLWLAALVCSMPLLIVSHRKLEALAMLLSEMAVPSTSPRAAALRPVLQHLLRGAGAIALAGLVIVSSTALLPPLPALVLLVVIAGALAWFFGRHFNAWYSRAKVALVDTWTRPAPPHENTPALPPLLDAAELELFEVKPGPISGKLIRELNLRARTGVSIVALDRAGKRMVNPGPDEELQTGDKILLLGEPAQLKTALALLATL